MLLQSDFEAYAPVLNLIEGLCRNLGKSQNSKPSPDPTPGSQVIRLILSSSN